MASTTIQKAIGTMKDQTSISLAIFSTTIPTNLQVAILKATKHNNKPTNEKHIHHILNLTSLSQSHATACIFTISRRLTKTRNWIVALKTLILVHRLLSSSLPSFQAHLFSSLSLNMSHFKDESHSNSYDHSALVRAYAFYLNCLTRNNKQASDDKVLDRIKRLQQLLDRLLACRPIGLAKRDRMVIVLLCPIVRESFQLYADTCDMLALLLDGFFEMDYDECVQLFEAYATAANQIDELNGFYGWCKEMGVASSAEFPVVQGITDKMLETLAEFIRDRIVKINSFPPIKALPLHSDCQEQQQAFEGDLIDLREDVGTPDAERHEFELALFSSGITGDGNADWELDLVETARKLGSASCIVLPVSGGVNESIGEDPFAASLSIPPPYYVQMSDFAKKQQMLMQGKHLLYQYTLNNAHYYSNQVMQYGIPTPVVHYYTNM